jgi:hypothetical protein
MVARYFDKLQEIFISLAARSKFPNIDNFTIQAFAQETGILDGQTVNISAVDRLFIAANVALNQTSEKENENSFVRHEFIEFLVRVADLKYKQTKVCKTAASSFQKLMTDHLLPFYNEYCTECNHLRETYLEGTIIDHNMFNNKKLFEHLYAVETARN